MKNEIFYFQITNLKMSFDKLYPDVKKHIISFIDLESLGRISQVSKEMKDLIYDGTKDLRAEKYIESKMITLDLGKIMLDCCKIGGPMVVIKYLIKNKCVDPRLGIKSASKHGHVEVVKLLLGDPRVDPSADDNYAIRFASGKGHVDVVKLLLSDPRVIPSAFDSFVIRWASGNGHVDVVKLLLSDPRVDPSAEYNYAIRWASRNGHVEVVKVLLNDPRVDPSTVDNYAIRFASENGHTKVVKVLLSDPRVGPKYRS
jgi:hypothetical protein